MLSSIGSIFSSYSMQKNIIYDNITTDGEVRIGEKNYVVERDFSQSILFLRIEKGTVGFDAMLSVKSIVDGAVNLFRETLQLTIPERLINKTDSFQNFRRGMEGNRFRSGFETHSPENWETELADEIYNTFFSGDIGHVCRDFLELLQSGKVSELLLVISTEDEQVQNLPWEMVLPKLTPGEGDELPRNNFGLIRSREKTLQRFVLQGPTSVAAPLKLLFIPALPENMDERNKLLEIEDEQRKIIEAVRALEVTGDQQPKLVMEILDCANLEEITEALEKRSHDIVHISGHGRYVEDTKKGILCLENEDGDQKETTGYELGLALRHISSIKLLVLSACETAVGGTLGSTAEQMAAVGLPAVLAMRFSVTDAGARLFTETLYKSLAYGDTLTKAMHDARLALWKFVQKRRTEVPNRFIPAEWFTPVLYQNQTIGALVKPALYVQETLDRFYPRTAFVKGAHTRLVGEGFIGRKRLLIQLRQAFNQGKHVCLHGLGGLGKTTTAEAFAEQYRKRNGVNDIVIFNSGAKIQEAVILETIYEHWKNRTKPDEWRANEVKEQLENPKVEIRQKLQCLINNCMTENRLILIFDNFEDVQTDEEGAQQQTIVSESLRLFFHDLLQKAPKTCHILFTTRYRIAGLENQVIHLPIDKMTYAEQYRFLNFSETLRRFPEKERDIIHRRIDGHPRGLQFLEGLVAKDQNFNLADFDTQVGKVEIDIFQNLMLDRIISQLTETEREVFTVASVFFSRSPVAALGAVMEKEITELLPVLASLSNWSICFWDESTKMFEVHALTRSWMRNQEKPEQGRFIELSERIGDYFQKQPASDDKILAKDYFLQADAWGKYADTAFKLEYDFRLAGLYSVARDILKEILEKKINPNIQAHALNRLGIIDNNIGAYNQSVESLQLGLQLNIQYGNKNGIGTSLNNIGQLYLVQGNYEKALENLEKSLPIRKETENRYGEGVTLNNIGQVYIQLDQCVVAMKYLKNSLFLRRQIEDRVGEGNTLNNIGFTLKKAGKYDRALKYLEESLRIRRNAGDKIGEGDSLNNIGQVYYSLKEFELAIEYSNQSLDIYEKIGAKSRQTSVLDDIGRAYFALGNHGKSLEYLNRILEIQKEIGNRHGEANILYQIGLIQFNQFQDLDTAFMLMFRAASILRELNSPDVEYPEKWLSSLIEQVGEEKYNQVLRYLTEQFSDFLSGR